MSPDRFEIDLTDANIDVTFTVSTTGASVPVVIDVTTLAHDLAGTPLFDPDAAPVLTVAPDRGSVAPDAPMAVHVTGSIPDGATALYAGVTVTIDRGADNAGVDAVTRVGVPLLLRGPRPWVETAAIDELAIPPVAAGQPARVEAVIRNTGDVHIRPTGRFTILQGDEVVATADLVGQTVLPGLARRLGAEWTPPDGLTGPLTVRLELDAPAASAERSDLPFPVAASSGDAPASAGGDRATQQPLGGGAGAADDDNNGGAARVIAAIVALLAILAVALAATRARSRTT